MKELKQRIEDLEARLGEASEASHKAAKRRVRPASREELESDGSEGRDIDIPAGPSIKSSVSPPTPSLSPEDHQDDPDETEPEPNLPPPLAFASEPAHSPRQPSIASLLAAASARSQQVPSQPAPPPEATNPTLYLPFPTPSPTSPFLTYHSTTSTTTSATGPAEPSPFLAPLQNMSLFGGALNLDHSNPNISPTQSFHPKHPSPPEMPPSRDIPAEEAANLLLAFSSPDTLRGATPKIRPAGVKERRSTLESEEFVLDGGVARESARGRKDGKEIETGRGTGMVGKTARDILRM